MNACALHEHRFHVTYWINNEHCASIMFPAGKSAGSDHMHPYSAEVKNA